MVYEPQEDSALLAKHVAVFAQGKVLDMGTGSGIQAMTAAGSVKVTSVLATDIDKEAIIHARKRNPHNKIAYKVSDLFSRVKGVFDTIIFNPPYLPAEQGLDDQALVGGKHGYETMCRFLHQALDHLSENGQIIASYSSLTKPEKVEECASQLLYDFKELDRQHVFFEDLLVVRFVKSEVRKHLEDDGFKKISYLAKGKRGMVFTSLFKGKKVAIKVKNPDSQAIASVLHEAEMLKRLGREGIGPKFIASSDLYVAYSFVDGVPILDFIESSSKPRILKVLKTAIAQCRTLDNIGVSKEEMTRPIKHILMTKGDKPVMIDFERAHFTQRPHNVTQFCQFLTSGHLKFSLASKGIAFDEDTILDLAQGYCKEPSDDRFKAIIGLLSCLPAKKTIL